MREGRPSMEWKVWSARKFACLKTNIPFRREHGLTEDQFETIVRSSPLCYSTDTRKKYGRVHVLITGLDIDESDLRVFFREYIKDPVAVAELTGVRGDFIVKCGMDLIADVFSVRRSDGEAISASAKTSNTIKEAARIDGYVTVPIGLTEEIFVFPNKDALNQFCIKHADKIPRPKKEFHVPAI